jgi:hypothetical protein
MSERYIKPLDGHLESLLEIREQLIEVIDRGASLA